MTYIEYPAYQNQMQNPWTYTVTYALSADQVRAIVQEELAKALAPLLKKKPRRKAK